VPQGVQAGWQRVLQQAPVDPQWRLRQLQEDARAGTLALRSVGQTIAARQKELACVRRRLQAELG